LIEDSDNYPKKTKPAVIIQVIHPSLKIYDVNEFRALAKAAYYDVLYEIVQKPDKVNPKYFIGTGKVHEIAERFMNLEGILPKEKIHTKLEKRSEEDLVFLFNNRLGSAQILELSEAFHYKVIDRDLLILEIFEQNAQTKESQLQIQLARMTLETTRKQKELSQKVKSERQGRDFKGKGYGAWVPILNAYKSQKKKIMEELMEIRKQRANQRKSRGEQTFKVSIIGYTNSGKTSLLNGTNNYSFKTKDTAFTTVTSVTRKIEENMVITATVGFVYDIPHQIIDAFLSTLEEAAYSDCIIFLIDLADLPEVIDQKVQTTFIVLSKIGCLNIPIVYTFNKIDLLTAEELEEKKFFIKNLLPSTAVVQFISTKDKKSIDQLITLLRMVRDKKIVVPTGQKFADEYLASHNEEIANLMDNSPEKKIKGSGADYLQEQDDKDF